MMVKLRAEVIGNENKRYFVTHDNQKIYYTEDFVKNGVDTYDGAKIYATGTYSRLETFSERQDVTVLIFNLFIVH